MFRTERPRVLLLIPHLGGGGAERVTTLLARELLREKYDVHLGLMTQKDGGGELGQAGVTVHALGARRVRTAAVKLLRLVRRLEPDLILSGMAHLNFLVLLLRPFFPRRTRVVVRQNSTVSSALAFGGLPLGTRFLYRALYPRADCVICQTDAMAADLAQVSGIPKARMAVLPNPVDVDAVRASVKGARSGGNALEGNSGGPHLLAIGRLSKEKGFDLLLQALAKVRRHVSSAHATIAGAGQEEEELRSRCSALGLECAVDFAGHVNDLSPHFARATVFVLPSRHEGMPNALLEAAAAGLPIVALPCSQGVIDLLRGRPGVWLAPKISVEALGESLVAALAALDPRQRFAHEFVEPFRLERAIAAYEDVIDAVLNEVGR